MRPEQQTTIPERPHMHISNLLLFCLKHILMLLNRKIKCNMLIYAFFYPIYIYKLLNSELRLISYEINHFTMAFSKINANNNFKHFKCCYHDADDNFKFYAILRKC